jgi:hypothetical protein
VCHVVIHVCGDAADSNAVCGCVWLCLADVMLVMYVMCVPCHPTHVCAPCQARCVGAAMSCRAPVVRMVGPCQAAPCLLSGQRPLPRELSLPPRPCSSAHGARVASCVIAPKCCSYTHFQPRPFELSGPVALPPATPRSMRLRGRTDRRLGVSLGVVGRAEVGHDDAGQACCVVIESPCAQLPRHGDSMCAVVGIG